MDVPPRSIFATTIDYRRHPRWAARSRYVPRPQTGTWQDALRILARVLRAARQERLLLLASSWGRFHPELFAAALVGLWPRHLRPRVVLLGCMWEPNSGARGRFEKLLVRFADRAICRYIVQSSEELSLFPQTWGVDAAKLRFCPHFFTLSEGDATRSVAVPPGDYIFAGGNSMRDYAPLVEAARRLPEHRFIFATRRLQAQPDLPPNVTVSPVSHEQYMGLLHGASIVVVPILKKLRRAAGQQTYLNALWLGKPTIVTDTLGVRDHIADGQSGLVVSGSPESYVTAIGWLSEPANQARVAAMGAVAQQVTREQFSFERHTDCVLDIVDEVLQEDRSAARMLWRNPS